MCEDLKLTVKHPIRDSREAAISGGFMGAAINVGEVYVQLVRDLREYTAVEPVDAVHAVRIFPRKFGAY